MGFQLPEEVKLTNQGNLKLVRDLHAKKKGVLEELLKENLEIKSDFRSDPYLDEKYSFYRIYCVKLQ